MKFKVLKEIKIGSTIVKPGSIISVNESTGDTGSKSDITKVSKSESHKNLQEFKNFLYAHKRGKTYYDEWDELNPDKKEPRTSHIYKLNLPTYPDIPQIINDIAIHFIHPYPYITDTYKKYKKQFVAEFKRRYNELYVDKQLSFNAFVNSKYMIEISTHMLNWYINTVGVLTVSDYWLMIEEHGLLKLSSKDKDEHSVAFVENIDTGLSTLKNLTKDNKDDSTTEQPNKSRKSHNTIKVPTKQVDRSNEQPILPDSKYYDKYVDDILSLFNNMEYHTEISEFIFDILEHKPREEMRHVNAAKFTLTALGKYVYDKNMEELNKIASNMPSPLSYLHTASNLYIVMFSPFMDLKKMNDDITFYEHKKAVIDRIKKLSINHKTVVKYIKYDTIMKFIYECIEIYNMHHNLSLNNIEYSQNLPTLCMHIVKMVYARIAVMLATELFRQYEDSAEYEELMRFVYKRSLK